ncbi:CBS domain-containing protein [Candidatus Pacearchaeota archaeon]|nr:CBS domain-containing protein [Candidatus Pacearchaeota archaeon]
MIVEEIMKKAFVVEKVASLSGAAKIMSTKGIGCLIVMSKNKIEGIVTERDLLKNFNKKGKVASVMSKQVTTISPAATLEDAVSLMRNSKIRRLPVMEKKELLGIVTATDLMAYAEEINDDFFFN